jgi:hypothetical protein
MDHELQWSPMDHGLKSHLYMHGCDTQAQVIKTRRILLIVVMLCLASICFSSLAASQPGSALGLNQLKQSGSESNAPATNAMEYAASKPESTAAVLKQDSGTNLSEMNITFSVSPTYGSAQTVKFTAPKAGWNLEGLMIMATDGWNASRKELPRPLPFAVEIRDAKLSLLYHFSDTQLPYFTSAEGVRIAFVEVPKMPIDGDFFVCFYGYRSVALATELQNATGNSYIYDKLTGKLYDGHLTAKNNQTIPINYIIRALGQ